MRCRSLAILVMALAAAASAAADPPHSETTLSLQAAYYFGTQEGYGTSGGWAPISYEVVPKEELAHTDSGRDLGSSWGSAGGKLILAHSVRWPLLAGSGPLFQDNHLKVTLRGELSPVSVNLAAEAAFTPIAIAEIAVGTSAGTGWSIPGLANGLGRNLPELTSGTSRSEPLAGLVLSGWASFTLQFDLEAVWPGQWHHVLLAAGPRLEYWAFTAAGPDEAWEWEADGGENFNGWRLASTSFLGYRMPLAVDMVGVLVTTSQYIGANSERSPMRDPGGWGSDFVRVSVSPLAEIVLSESTKLLWLVQIDRAPDYTDATIGNRYFEYRDYDGAFFYLRRVCFVLTARLR